MPTAASGFPLLLPRDNLLPHNDQQVLDRLVFLSLLQRCLFPVHVCLSRLGLFRVFRYCSVFAICSSGLLPAPQEVSRIDGLDAVSYTHLTLPTILRV